MKKEILFRGKFDNGNGMMCWIEGDLIHYSDDEVYIMDQNYRLWDIQHDGVRINDLNTIGQYTGLKDKDGNKIFEGDILSIEFIPIDCDSSHYYEGEVLFLQDRGIYIVDMKFGYLSFNMMEGASAHTYSYSIIGNVHDTSTLE